MSNGYNLQMRGDGRRKFNYNYQDVEIESLLGKRYIFLYILQEILTI